MNQLEFIEFLEDAIKNKLELFEIEKVHALEHLKDFESVIRESYKNYFIDELSKDYCQHYDAAGYECWYDYFGDTDGAKYEMWMRELLTEEKCDEIWNKAHKR